MLMPRSKATYVSVTTTRLSEKVRDNGKQSHGRYCDSDQRYSVAETWTAWKQHWGKRGLKFSPGLTSRLRAVNAGLTLRPTQILIFGSPQAGTPLMSAFPTLALDLPLRSIGLGSRRWPGSAADHTPGFLQSRYGLPQPPFGAMEALFDAAVSAPSAVRTYPKPNSRPAVPGGCCAAVISARWLRLRPARTQGGRGRRRWFRRLKMRPALRLCGGGTTGRSALRLRGFPGTFPGHWRGRT